MDARTIGHVVEYRHGKGVGALEYHSDALPEILAVDAALIDILSIESNLSCEPRPGYLIVHPVQASKKCGFTTTGRADQCGYTAIGNIQIDAVEGVERTVIEID